MTPAQQRLAAHCSPGTIQSIRCFDQYLREMTANERHLFRERWNDPGSNFAQIGKSMGISKQGTYQMAQGMARSWSWTEGIVIGDSKLSKLAFGGIPAQEHARQGHWAVMDSYTNDEGPHHFLFKVLKGAVESVVVHGGYDIVDDEIVLMPGAEMREVA